MYGNHYINYIFRYMHFKKKINLTTASATTSLFMLAAMLLVAEQTIRRILMKSEG